MTETAFVELVERLQVQARERPALYRTRVVLLAALAYAYVLGVVVAALGLVVSLVGLALISGKPGFSALKYGGKAVLLLLGLVWAILRALWVRFEPPTGIVLERVQVPQLFAMLDDTRRRMRAPRLHRVLLDAAFNASIVQHPRLGILGWQRNYVILGLPLLQAVSSDEARAIIAHELGHLSGAHGRTGAWIYRARVSWSRLLSRLEEEGHWSSFVFRPFFRWYAPYFNAYSFVLARGQEYQADASGAEIAGAGALARSLIRVKIAAAHLSERYWDAIQRRAREVAAPDVRPFHGMGRARLAHIDPQDAQRWLEGAMAEETTVGDTHPCLRDRLDAVGQTARLPEPLRETAAEELLGGALDGLCAELDADWLRRNDAGWRAAYAQAEKNRQSLAELEEEVAKGSPDVETLWKRARLSEELEGGEVALPLYEAVIALQPQHASARFALGRLLLERDDARGLEHIETSIEATRDALLPGAQCAVAFLRRAGREEDAGRWIERARTHHAKEQAAEAERATLKIDGRYEAHGLAEDALAALRRALEKKADVEAAWLVRRQLEHYPERPLFALGVRRRARWFESASDRRARDLSLQEQLKNVPCPGEAFILVVNHRPRSQRRLFESVPGARIL